MTSEDALKNIRLPEDVRTYIQDASQEAFATSGGVHPSSPMRLSDLDEITDRLREVGRQAKRMWLNHPEALPPP